MHSQPALKGYLDLIGKRKVTSLCVGPLSPNIIKSAIECSNERNIPLVLVASRRQLECSEFGGGYVNSWTMADLIEFVARNEGKNIIFERDHGGPWQGKYEIAKKLGVEESMAAAKKSFEADIDAGVQILHIDPTVPINGEILDEKLIQSRLFELYGHISEYARSKNKKVYLEIGTEEQNGSYTDLVEFESFLRRTTEFCDKEKFDRPLFVVIQTGAKVIENRNIGLFERGSRFDKSHLMKNISEASVTAAKFDIFIKEHNADYLAFENLCLRPHIGVAASNVAPEFGYLETKALLFYLQNFGVAGDIERFTDVVVASKTWVKWMQPDSTLKNYDKACLAGHYCYNMSEVVAIRERLEVQMRDRGLDLDENLRRAVKTAIFKYCNAFGMI